MTEPATPAPPPDSQPATQPWYRRRPDIAIPTAAALVIALVIGGIALSTDRPTDTVAAPTPVRTAVEQAYLSDVHASTGELANLNTDDQLIVLGHWNCDKLRTLGAVSFKTIVDGYVAKGYPLTGVSFVNISINHFCPEIWNQFGTTTATEPAAAAVATPTPTYPLSQVTSGTYLVGSEVAPGQYVTEGGSICYWERDKDTEGTFGSIISNGNAQGHTTVTIKSSDKAFKVTGSCTFTKR